MSYSYSQVPYFLNSQTNPQVYTTPILQEVPPSEFNIPKSNDDLEELCTNECHSESCKCDMTKEYDKCEESEETSEEESDTELENEKTHPEICECETCFLNREEEINKIQQELEQKVKFQREYREKQEREKQRKLKEEKERLQKEQEEKDKQIKLNLRKGFVEKINKIVSEYNEQRKKCEQLLKTYDAENIKLSQLNTEYYKLKYQLDNIDNKTSTFELNQVLYPFFDILRK
jgi:chemotaxis protein histidine kinase CheA